MLTVVIINSMEKREGGGEKEPPQEPRRHGDQDCSDQWSTPPGIFAIMHIQPLNLTETKGGNKTQGWKMKAVSLGSLSGALTVSRVHCGGGEPPPPAAGRPEEM